MDKLRKYWPILFLSLASVILCALNYTPGTILSGWDTLHPEFDFGLNIQRTIFGVFRTEQGLGAVAAHSHMADLPRILLLYVEHFLLPQNFLRYSYIFLNLILGPIGMYLFLEKHLLKNKIASFLGGLFYLLNLGTMQIFNVPFEMFTTLFATLPFVFLFATNYLSSNKNRVINLLLFCTFILFTSPSAYASTLWYLFFGCLVLYLVSFSFVNKHKLKDSLVLIGLTLLINAFWIAPNIYFILNHAKEVQNANINILFSDQAFLKNKEFGNPISLLLLKSFYFDWNVYGSNGGFTYLLSPYIDYLKNIPVLLTGFGLGISFIVGAISFIKNLKSKSIPFILLLAVSLFFLINNNFPVSPLFKLLQDHFPFFKEALRFPDDKIFNIYIFIISIFFGYFCLFIIEKLNKKTISIFALAVVAIIGLYSLPSFTGNFINKNMRVQIPNSYFTLFEYLKTQPSEPKVANLPIHSQWGWVYYDWYKNKPSFQGAGFLYFGIKQPLLDRDFDRWSPYNESYFREMSYAIYKEDKALLKNVIKKYNIGYIFIDTSVTDPQHPKSTLFFSESEKLIKETGLVSAQKNFGKIILFKLKTESSSNFRVVNATTNVNPKTTTIYNDQAYNNFGDYITSTNSYGLSSLIYPFRDLINNKSQINPKVVSLDDEKITFTPQSMISDFKTQSLSENLDIIPSDLILEKENGTLNFSIYPNTPIFDNTSLSSPIKGSVEIDSLSSNLLMAVNENDVFDLSRLVENTPFAVGKVSLNNGDNTVSIFDKTGIIPIANTVKVISPFFSDCDDNGPISAQFIGDNINISSKGDACVLIPYGFFPNNDQGLGILTNFGFDSNSRKKITACLYSQESSKCLYYIQPQKNGNTYNFSFPLSQTNSSKRAIKIFFEKDSNLKSLTLSNLTSSYSKSISDINISKSLIQNTFIQTQNLSFDKIYLSKNNTYDPGFQISSLNKLNNDCGITSDTKKKELVNINNQAMARYTSENGTFCDHFSYPNLLHKLGYLVIVDSKNDSGLPLTMCITNYTTRKCDIYTILSYNKELKKEVFLLSPSDNNGVGYDINLESNGIDGSPAINYLKSVEFVPIPYGFLTNIHSLNKTNTNDFVGKIENITTYNPDMYLIKTNGKPMILSLDYSYEKGFKAYPISCNSELGCFIKTLLAPIFDKELDQVLINNWSNGWITIGQTQIAVVFAPQYLEWLGFIIIAGIFSTLLIKTRKSSN